jgi:putative copper export protein
LLIPSRFVHFAALTFLFGASLFRIFVQGAPDGRVAGVRVRANFCNGFKVICSVQSRAQK